MVNTELLRRWIKIMCRNDPGNAAALARVMDRIEQDPIASIPAIGRHFVEEKTVPHMQSLLFGLATAMASQHGEEFAALLDRFEIACLAAEVEGLANEQAAKKKEASGH